jgi:uncharacterized protein with HEPN domain
MTLNRLGEYLDHVRQAATDAITFVDGLSKKEFLEDKRTQQAVIMSLIIIGEASTKIMDQHPDFAASHRRFLGVACAVCAIGLPMVISILTLR